MTLDGTNTWVLRERGAQECIVVDPGPLDEAHLTRVLDVVRRDGGRVGLTLLTHDHSDHADAAERFAHLSGAPVRAIRAIGTGHDDLADGDSVSVGGLDLVVVTTPGHTSDSVSFLLPAECAVLTGDTILGRGTTVVAWPDGELAAYLASLARLEALCGSGAVARILPGHGPHLPDAGADVVVLHGLDDAAGHRLARFQKRHGRQPRRLRDLEEVDSEGGKPLLLGPASADRLMW